MSEHKRPVILARGVILREAKTGNRWRIDRAGKYMSWVYTYPPVPSEHAIPINNEILEKLEVASLGA